MIDKNGEWYIQKGTWQQALKLEEFNQQLYSLLKDKFLDEVTYEDQIKISVLMNEKNLLNDSFRVVVDEVCEEINRPENMDARWFNYT